MPSINSHFSREAKIMIGLLVVPLVVGLIVSIFAPSIMHQLDVDRCLDSGGKFDYDNSTCIGGDQSE